MALTYVRAIGSALAQGALTATWIAARELPTRQRRLVRAGATVSIAAVGWFSSASDERSIDWTAGEGVTVKATPDDTPQPLDARRVAVSLMLGGLSIGMLVGRRQLEKRWLARLEEKGHEHPHRALALRLGLLTVATTLPGRLQAARDAQRKAVDLDRG